MDTIPSQVPSFGVFDKLGDYGVLGLVVLALGYVGWILFKRHLDNQDRIKQELQNKKKPKK